MSKLAKTFGPSNDAIQLSEFQLAAMIQNANAFGLKPCRGQYYRDDNGAGCGYSDAAYCCASGAYSLCPLINGPHPNGSVIAGNDDKDNFFVECEGYTVGTAFQEAMAD